MRALLLLAVSLAACDGETAPASGLDPDVAPVTAGAWIRPAPDVTWQWQLTGAVNTSYDADLYDVDLYETPGATLDALHRDGRAVLCYFSAGSFEAVRPDAGLFPPAAIGRPLDGFPDERWLDVRSPAVFAAMLGRLDRAAERGCDGVEPDNVDGFANDTGFPLTARDQLAFVRALANAAHARGLAVALKNTGDLAPALVDYVDLGLNEQCHEFEECEQLRPFTAAGKPVLNAEYAATEAAAQDLARTVCPAAAAAGRRTLILPLALDDAWRVACF